MRTIIYLLLIKWSTKKKQNKPSSNTKANEDKFEKVSVDSVKTIPNLVKLDLNLEILNNYLEDIQEAVNDHAPAISSL